MIKYLLVGVWVCLVTLGTSYATVSWKAGQKSPSEEESKFFGGLDYVKTNVISVPMIEEGEIMGYVIAQFIFTMDGKVLRKMSVPPNVFLVDEAFKVLYASHSVKFKKLKKQDLRSLSKTLKANVNKRFEAKLVESVLIEQLNYVPRTMSRSLNTQSKQKQH